MQYAAVTLLLFATAWLPPSAQAQCAREVTSEFIQVELTDASSVGTDLVRYTWTATYDPVPATKPNGDPLFVYKAYFQLPSLSTTVSNVTVTIFEADGTLLVPETDITDATLVTNSPGFAGMFPALEIVNTNPNFPELLGGRTALFAFTTVRQEPMNVVVINNGSGNFRHVLDDVWTLDLCAALPVELTDFDAVVDGNSTLLRWNTASETNNAGFEVQHAVGSGDFARLDFVSGAGTTLEAQAYAHRIEGLAPGRHRFRLKQVDYDGAFEYSPVVEVAVDLPGAFELSGAYPNPFNPQTQFTLAVARQQQVRVEVFNLLGERVAMLHEGTLQANQVHTFRFEAGDLPSGVYLYRATGETFTAVRQVMLLK